MKLFDRVKNILTAPRREWTVIDAEPATPAELYTGYVVPLAAIGPVASWLGFSFVGMTIPFLGTYRIPVGTGLARALVEYILALVGVYVLALVIDWFAPRFGGTANPIQALKVAVYACTAAWVAGIFGLVPALSILSILGLYSLFLLYLGLPVLMKSPRERSLAYTVTVVIVAIVIFVLIRIVGSIFVRLPTARFS